MRTVRAMLGSLILALSVLFLSRATISPVRASGPTPDTPPDIPAGVDCSQIQELGIDRQVNARAEFILQYCGLFPSAGAVAATAVTPASALTFSGPMSVGGTDGQVNNALADTYPHVTQNQGSIAGDGKRLAVGYISTTAAPTNYSGYSYSTDGGATFTEIRPSPFATGHGTNYGDPTMLYNSLYARWVSVWTVSGCGGIGLGTWEAGVPDSWGAWSCLHMGTMDDNSLGWVDNNPTSPYYGRMYVTWNDLSTAAGLLDISVSTNGGLTWSAPVLVNGTATSIRNVFVTGAPDGTVYVVGEDEGGGGTNPRHNYIFRSINGGTSWTLFSMGASFTPPGDTTCGIGSYYRAVSPRWREMGAGQAGVGTGGVIHYAYTAGGMGDAGDIYYTRSTDRGATWSTPLRLNTDTGTRGQWQPSLAVTADGKVVVTWYDRRNTTDNSYQRFQRISLNNGSTWEADGPLSDVVIPQPQEPDSSPTACQGGRRAFSFAAGHTVFGDWTDGRITITVPQEDEYLDRIDTTTSQAACTQSILLLYSEINGGLPTTLQDALLGQSGVGRVDLFDIHSGTPTLAQLKGYDGVFVYRIGTIADSIALGNVLADYADAGGVVIQGAYAFSGAAFAGIQGRWVSGGYTPYSATGSTGTTMTVNLGGYDSTSPLMAGVTSLSTGDWQALDLTSGATQIAAWSSFGLSAIAVKGRVVGVNAGLNVFDGDWKGQWALLFANAIKTLHTGPLVSCKLMLPLLER